MRVVTEKAQHDEIRVKSVETMSNVGIVIGLGFRQANVFHYLVFSFTRHLMAG